MTERINVGLVSEKRLLDVNEGCSYTSTGRNSFVKFARSIGAERRIGRRCLYDKEVIDRYLDKQAREAQVGGQ